MSILRSDQFPQLQQVSVFVLSRLAIRRSYTNNNPVQFVCNLQLNRFKSLKITKNIENPTENSPESAL